MSKGKGRLLVRGEHYESTDGVHSHIVRVPDGYRPTHVAVMPVEDQPVGDTDVLGWAYTIDSVPAVTTGGYYNAVFIRFRNLVDSVPRGIFYQVFYEPVDGSDLANAETL